jgi:methylenetetrahydrofolate dehydrogenase (NADP+)/methenyltetrahydrofolate cyclohydrolase
VQELNRDPNVDGILVQLPVPKGVSSLAVIQSISPEKDVDGFHVSSVGGLWSGQGGFVPCTPRGCIRLLKEVGTQLDGARAVVVGRSNIVGKPVAALLLAENATVTIAHSKTRDLPAVCREADVLVLAVGRAKLVTGDWVKPGATVIDVGVNRIPAPERGEGKTRLVGDVDYGAAAAVAGAISPVPGGVGPMTIACLLANAVTTASLINGLTPPKDLTP